MRATGEMRLTVPQESYRIPIKPEHLKLVREAMVEVNISGTGRRAFEGAPYKVGGKTGTAQVISIKQNEKYVESRVDERHRDHSLFIAFAPADDPKIALAVIVENGGFGARAAAPIARQVIDYQLARQSAERAREGRAGRRSAVTRRCGAGSGDGAAAGQHDGEGDAMNNATVAQRIGGIARPYIAVFDPALMAIVGSLGVIGLITLYSAGNDFPWRVTDQIRNFGIAFAVLFVAANVRPQWLMRLALPVYVIGVGLLIATEISGETVKGATRWLDIKVTRIQPSEIMKLGVPMMLAWYFHKREGALRGYDFLVAAMLLAVPVALILKQPDLGTAVLVFAAGVFVIFFAGLPWKWLAVMLVSGVALLPVAWTMLHDYQRERVMTLIDPSTDPLGKGFHTLQAMIAIGSGGTFGKGWMQGTQAHLEFIPERTSDFIFAVYSEEFGLVGNVVLVLLFFALVWRAFAIAINAPTLFARLLAAAIGLIMFTYAFVNMGMVSGILPVVGVPLPFISYGGTALVTLGMACGLLMAISAHRKFVQS